MINDCHPEPRNGRRILTLAVLAFDTFIEILFRGRRGTTSRLRMTHGLIISYQRNRQRLLMTSSSAVVTHIAHRFTVHIPRSSESSQ
jgi:hypothetical protein